MKIIELIFFLFFFNSFKYLAWVYVNLGIEMKSSTFYLFMCIYNTHTLNMLETD